MACLLYGLFIVAGKAYFSTRPPWNLRRLLALWNLSLSVFSFVGLVRVFPAIVHLWATYTSKENFCMDPESSFGSGSTGLWVQLFILSKFPYVRLLLRERSGGAFVSFASLTDRTVAHTLTVSFWIRSSSWFTRSRSSSSIGTSYVTQHIHPSAYGRSRKHQHECAGKLVGGGHCRDQSFPVAHVPVLAGTITSPSCSTAGIPT